MTTEPTPDLRALAEAAEGNGEHIYTHPRDSNKWRENEAWHRAASPGAVLHLLDRIEELEARKPLPLSYRSGVMTSGVEGGATVSLHFTDMAEAEAWFVEITDQYDAALVDKSPNLQEELVDKTAKLQDRPAPLSDDEIIAAQEALALSRSRIGLPCTRCGTGKYRADRNAYHDFHRCDNCMHVPMWGDDGKELGPPTCTGESS
ncbi:hypothetical protein [Delftia tsuruhatensis]|uniref:hypothetical protein n=1 Tax=Delftia tsuruhatensis TaxID=180282 RepID=UPI0023DBB7DB|nr:hypothetical protein [Delftia tsuruhatensis]WEL97016.1 hypothetical protein PW274_23510 [Delftia tsuruhatensis]WQM84848.1 hypothetical protein RNT40_08355 [Delftia tsuruhatensis]